MSATVKEEEGDFTVTVTTPRALLLTSSTTAEDVDSWLKRNLPSNASSTYDLDGTIVPTPWIWVQTSKDGSDAPEGSAPSAAFLSEVAAIELSLTDDCQAIADNPGLPTQGKNSKAKARAAKHVEAVAALEATAKKHGMTSGKWLFYTTEADDVCDVAWRKIVLAMAPGGPAHGLIRTAKIATESNSGNQRVVCTYVDNSFSRDEVTDALRALIRGTGLKPNSFKADVYTYAGIDSKHSSKCPSTLYLPNIVAKAKADRRPGLLTDEEIEELQQEFKDGGGTSSQPKASKSSPAPAAKPRKLDKEEKRKAAARAQFDDVSSDDDKPPAKKSKAKA